jgi:hypothetical protein
MSSPGLPRLDIEVGQRRVERWIAAAGSALCLILPSLTARLLGVGLLPGATMGLLLATGCVAGFYRAGWIGGMRRIQRVVCHSHGDWLLLDAGGQSREARLSADTRFGPGCLWLRWETGDPRSLLLASGDLPADQLRRLSVRLRIDRDQPVAISRAAAI